MNVTIPKSLEELVRQRGHVSRNVPCPTVFHEVDSAHCAAMMASTLRMANPATRGTTVSL